MDAIRNLESLTMDELAGVIHAHPWFGAAHRELCERMSSVGGSQWGREQYAEAALYVSSRTIIHDILRSTRKEDYSDKDVQTLLKKYISPEPPAPAPQPYRRTVRVAGGDFFSSDQYESVRREEDNFFSKFKAARSDEEDGRKWEDPEIGFCTETLAGIYAEQGYFAEAKKIYSRLILRYPEKSAYFATLIEKMGEEN